MVQLIRAAALCNTIHATVLEGVIIIHRSITLATTMCHRIAFTNATLKHLYIRCNGTITVQHFTSFNQPHASLHCSTASICEKRYRETIFYLMAICHNWKNVFWQEQWNVFILEAKTLIKYMSLCGLVVSHLQSYVKEISLTRKLQAFKC